MDASQSFQQNILDKVIFRFAKKSEAIKAMATLLKISQDAVYRRMRGDSYLTPQEIFKLVSNFKIPLDQLINTKQTTVPFEFFSYDTNVTSIEDYLKKIAQLLERSNRLTNPKIYVATSDLPIFYYALSPSLFKFKLYVWGNTIWDFNLFKETPFSLKLFPYYIDQHIKQIKDAYFSIETIELWSLSLIEDTLNQISYFLYCDRFEDQSVLWMLFDELQSLTKQLKQIAKVGFKKSSSSLGSKGKISIYHNEVIHGVSTILMKSKELAQVFTPLSNPNYLITKDEDTCANVEHWFDKLIAKSNKISVQNEKNRSWFFHQLTRKIEFAKDQLKSVV